MKKETKKIRFTTYIFPEDKEWIDEYCEKNGVHVTDLMCWLIHWARKNCQKGLYL